MLRCLPTLDAIEAEGDVAAGERIVKEALRAPLHQIAENSGFDGAVSIEEALEREGAFGMDARTGEWVDMWEHGITDPTKVTRTALQKAASVAGLMLITDTLVTDRKEEQELVAGAVG